MTSNARRPLLSMAVLLVLLAGLFLSFSRGGWGVAGGSVLVMAGLTFVTAPDLRLRLLISTVIGAISVAALIALALTIEPGPGNLRRALEPPSEL
jgi:hypothetical protein